MLNTIYQPPSGLVAPFAGATVPQGWLDCDGSAISRTTYAALFAALGTTWGAGDGSTTFNLPDLRGRAPIGVGTGSGLTARTLGASGGAETHLLNGAEGPSHSHTFSSGAGFALCYVSSGGTHNWDNAGGPNNLATIPSSTDSSGSGTAHNNMQPYAALKFIIKT